MNKSEKGSASVILTTAIVATIIGIIALDGFFDSISAGTVGVVTKFGKVTGRVMQPGMNTKTPFVEGVTIYNTKKLTYETAVEENQKTSEADYKDFPVSTTTSDGQGVTVTYTVRFRIDPSKATWIMQSIGNEAALVEKIVKTESRGFVRSIIREFQAGDLYSGNIEDVRNRIVTTLRPKFEANGLILDEFIIREPKFAEEYENIMEDKQQALEQVDVEQHKAEQAEYRKAAKIAEAEAEAEAQRLLSVTATTQSIEMKRLEVEMKLADKWNGAYPTHMYMFGSDGPLGIGSIPIE